MPRPPPPADALTSTGRSAALTAPGSSSSSTGTPAAAISFLASILLPMAAIASGGGPIQVSPASTTACANAGVLGQEPVTGVHRVGAGPARRRDEQVGAQVGVCRRRAGQPHRAVGLAHMRRIGVGVGEHRDRVDAQGAARPEHPPRDLAPVGDQHPR